jgi:hypothetical protein
MSCESGAVEVDHASSVPNSCPIVTSFGFEKSAFPGTVLAGMDPWRSDAGVRSHPATDPSEPDAPLSNQPTRNARCTSSAFRARRHSATATDHEQEGDVEHVGVRGTERIPAVLGASRVRCLLCRSVLNRHPSGYVGWRIALVGDPDCALAWDPTSSSAASSDDMPNASGIAIITVPERGAPRKRVRG